MPLSELSMLTLADFSIVVRQLRALGARYYTEQLLGALEAECQARMTEGRQVK